jgi:hypothetical protein
MPDFLEGMTAFIRNFYFFVGLVYEEIANLFNSCYLRYALWDVPFNTALELRVDVV